MGRRITVAFVVGLALGCGGNSSRRGADGASGDGGTNASGGTAGGGGATGGTAGTAQVPSEEEVACTYNSECVFEPVRCCYCHVSKLDDAVAVNAASAQGHRNRVCAETAACPGCTNGIVGVEPYLIATCRAGRCVGVDITETAITACTTKDDCKFRSDRCCGCSPTRSGTPIPIGVGQDAAYEALRCDPGEACAECSVEIPEGADFMRGCDGHCTILGFPQ